MSKNNLFSENKDTAQENICVVKLTTACWKDTDSRGVHLNKSLNFLRRRCKGYNILEDDCYNLGDEEVISRIINLGEVEDGVYQVVICNEQEDWETGHVDSYDYKLVAIES